MSYFLSVTVWRLIGFSFLNTSEWDNAGFWHQEDARGVTSCTGLENTHVFEYCSKGGHTETQTAWVLTRRKKNVTIMSQYPKDTQSVPKHASSLCSSSTTSWRNILFGAGYCIQMSLTGTIFGKGCASPWVPRNKLTLQFNSFLQPALERAANQPLKAVLMHALSIKTSNQTCHKLSLQAFMADNKHVLIAEQLRPVSSTNGAAFLIKWTAYQGT